MTAWHIASIPFCILGVLFALASIVVVPMRRPNETTEDLAGQFIISLLACGVVLVIAAWLWS